MFNNLEFIADKRVCDVLRVQAFSLLCLCDIQGHEKLIPVHGSSNPKKKGQEHIPMYFLVLPNCCSLRSLSLLPWLLPSIDAL
jgi:hypothetical protein